MSFVYSVVQDILPNDEVRFAGSFWQVFDTLRTPDGRITLLLDSISEDRGVRVSLAPLDLIAVIDDDADEDDESDPAAVGYDPVRDDTDYLRHNER